MAAAVESQRLKASDVLRGWYYAKLNDHKSHTLYERFTEKNDIQKYPKATERILERIKQFYQKYQQWPTK